MTATAQPRDDLDDDWTGSGDWDTLVQVDYEEITRKRSERTKKALARLAAANSNTVGGLGWWTDERIATLRRLWAKGVSVDKIAKQMGTSRGAVSGKRDRLGLPLRRDPVRGGLD